MTWRVRVQIGSLILEAEQLAPGVERVAVDVPVPSLLAVSWVDQVADDTWPARQGPSTGQVTVRFPTASEFSSVNQHTPVSVKLYRHTDDATPVAGFYGRVSEPDITPHARGVDARFPLTDYLTELAGDTVGNSLWPQENAAIRLERMFTAAGLAAPSVIGLSDRPVLAERAKSSTTLLTLAQETLSWAVFTAAGAPAMRELRPNITASGGLDGLVPYELSPLPRLADATGVLVYTDDPIAGTAGFEPDPAIDPAHVIDAGTVLSGGTWRRTRTSDTDTIVVTTADDDKAEATSRPPGRDKVVERVETQLQSTADAQLLADYLLPDESALYLPRWEAERFTVSLNHTPDDYWPGELRDVRVVTGIPAQHNPAGTDWTAGVILAREIRLGDGRAEVDLTLGSRPVTGLP